MISYTCKICVSTFRVQPRNAHISLAFAVNQLRPLPPWCFETMSTAFSLVVRLLRLQQVSTKPPTRKTSSTVGCRLYWSRIEAAGAMASRPILSRVCTVEPDVVTKSSRSHRRVLPCALWCSEAAIGVHSILKRDRRSRFAAELPLTSLSLAPPFACSFCIFSLSDSTLRDLGSILFLLMIPVPTASKLFAPDPSPLPFKPASARNAELTEGTGGTSVSAKTD